MSYYGRHNGAVVAISGAAAEAAPSDPYIDNVQANYIGQISGVGTPATIVGYAPPSVDDKVLIVIATSRNAGTLGGTKTFAGNGLVNVGDESGTGAGNATRFFDRSLGDGAVTAGDVLVSFAMTGATGTDRVLLIALTGCNLAQAGAAHADDHGSSFTTLTAGADLVVTFTGHAVGDLLVSLVFRKTGSNGTRGPTVKAGEPQTEALTTASTSGADIYSTLGWSVADTTDPITHTYQAADDGDHGWQWASWTKAP